MTDNPRDEMIRTFTLDELCRTTLRPYEIEWMVHYFGRSEIVKRLGARFVDDMRLLFTLNGISAENRDKLSAQSHRIIRAALARHAPSKRVRVHVSPWPDIHESDPHGLYEYDYTGVVPHDPFRTIVEFGGYHPDAVVMDFETRTVLGRAHPRRVLSERGRFVLRLRDTVARSRTRPLSGTKVFP